MEHNRPTDKKAPAYGSRVGWTLPEVYDTIGLQIMRLKNALHLKHKCDKSVCYIVWLTFVSCFERQ